jgi:hypothetical protein
VIDWKKFVREAWQSIVAVLIIVAVWFVIGKLFAGEIPANNKEALLQIIGAIISWGGFVVGYYFGSSKGSADKSDQQKPGV